MTDFLTRFPDAAAFAAYIGSNFDLSPVQWTTGGITGGNCWNEGGHYSVEAEDEPELTVLDEILLDVFPSLSFIQYRVLTKREIVVTTRGTDREYYGNYTEFSKKFLDVDVLYWSLVDLCRG